jgi:hypothetical protein
MTDMERAWAYGRIIRQIWDEGQKTRKLLSRYKHHKIMLVPAEAEPEELADIERRRKQK